MGHATNASNPAQEPALHVRRACRVIVGCSCVLKNSSCVLQRSERAHKSLTREKIQSTPTYLANSLAHFSISSHMPAFPRGGPHVNKLEMDETGPDTRLRAYRTYSPDRMQCSDRQRQQHHKSCWSTKPAGD